MATKRQAISPLGSDAAADFEREAQTDPVFAAAVEKFRLAHELATRLIGFRLEHRLTQKQLAARLDMKDTVVSRYERGDRPVSLETLRRIGDVLAFDVVLVSRKPGSRGTSSSQTPTRRRRTRTKAAA